MYLFKAIIASVVVFLTINVISVGCMFFASRPTLPSCPPSQLFHPCECYLHAEHMKIIRCGGSEPYDLVPVFERLSAHLSSDAKHFHMFYLNNTGIVKLGNVFRDITFDYIYFDGASSLQAIDPKAFEITGPSVKEVRAFNTQLKQTTLDDSVVGLPNLLHLTVSNVGQCPPEELVKPCRCQHKQEEWQWVQAKFTRIICGEQREEDMRSAYLQTPNRTEEQVGYYTMRRLQIFFERLSENLNKINWQKRFDEFVLQNSPIAELPRNIFNDIIFYGIKIDNCPKLTSIHPMAFTITAPFVQELLIRRTKLANDRHKQRDIFNAITSLENLRALYLHWSGLMSIPHHAFRPLKGKFQRKLVKVSVKYTKSDRTALRMIGSYAFYYLSNLKTIDLSLNNIVKIYRNAFSLRWPSTEPLEVNLAGNNLTETSIDPSAFLEAHRPVHIVLGQGAIGNPHLHHLDEGVFRLFLKENTKNKVKFYSSKNTKGQNRLSCDCKSKWMFDETGRVRSGLEDVMCYSNVNTSWECLPQCLIFGHDLLHCGSNKWFDFKEELSSLSTRLLPSERHFKRFVLSNTEVETLPDRAFGEITFEHLELDGCSKLKTIQDKAFENFSDKLQRIVIRQTTQLSNSKTNLLKFSEFTNLTHLDVSFDGEFRLFNTSFLTDIQSNKTLYIRLNRDKIKADSIQMNAFNGAKRPIHLFFDSYKDVFDPMGCQLMRLEEEIYAPFLAGNPYNQIHIMWCPIICDCSIRWLFDAPKDWWRRVDAGDQTIGVQCSDHRSLYRYSDSEFKSCPKTNLLKYFEWTTTVKTTVWDYITTTVPTTVQSFLMANETTVPTTIQTTLIEVQSTATKINTSATTEEPTVPTKVVITAQPVSETDAPTTVQTQASTTTSPVAQTSIEVRDHTFASTPVSTKIPTTDQTSAQTTVQTDAPITVQFKAEASVQTNAPTIVPTIVPTNAPTTVPTHAQTVGQTDDSTTHPINSKQNSSNDLFVFPTTTPTSISEEPENVVLTTGQSFLSAESKTTLTTPTNDSMPSSTNGPTTEQTTAPTTVQTNETKIVDPTTLPPTVQADIKSDAPTTVQTNPPTTLQDNVQTTVQTKNQTPVPTTISTEADITTVRPTVEANSPTTVQIVAQTTVQTTAPTTVPTKSPPTEAITFETTAPTTVQIKVNVSTDAPIVDQKDVPTTVPIDSKMADPTTTQISISKEPENAVPTSGQSFLSAESKTTITTPANESIPSPTNGPTTEQTTAPTTVQTNEYKIVEPTAVPSTVQADIITDVPTTAQTDPPTTLPIDAQTKYQTSVPTTVQTIQTTVTESLSTDTKINDNPSNEPKIVETTTLPSIIESVTTAVIESKEQTTAQTNAPTTLLTKDETTVQTKDQPSVTTTVPTGADLITFPTTHPTNLPTTVQFKAETTIQTRGPTTEETNRPNTIEQEPTITILASSPTTVQDMTPTTLSDGLSINNDTSPPSQTTISEQTKTDLAMLETELKSSTSSIIDPVINMLTNVVTMITEQTTVPPQITTSESTTITTISKEPETIEPTTKSIFFEAEPQTVTYTGIPVRKEVPTTVAQIDNEINDSSDHLKTKQNDQGNVLIDAPTTVGLIDQTTPPTTIQTSAPTTLLEVLKDNLLNETVDQSQTTSQNDQATFSAADQTTVSLPEQTSVTPTPTTSVLIDLVALETIKNSNSEEPDLSVHSLLAAESKTTSTQPTIDTKLNETTNSPTTVQTVAPFAEETTTVESNVPTTAVPITVVNEFLTNEEINLKNNPSNDSSEILEITSQTSPPTPIQTSAPTTTPTEILKDSPLNESSETLQTTPQKSSTEESDISVTTVQSFLMTEEKTTTSPKNIFMESNDSDSPTTQQANSITEESLATITVQSNSETTHQTFNPLGAETNAPNAEQNNEQTTAPTYTTTTVQKATDSIDLKTESNTLNMNPSNNSSDQTITTTNPTNEATVPTIGLEFLGADPKGTLSSKDDPTTTTFRSNEPMTERTTHSDPVQSDALTTTPTNVPIAVETNRPIVIETNDETTLSSTQTENKDKGVSTETQTDSPTTPPNAQTVGPTTQSSNQTNIGTDSPTSEQTNAPTTVQTNTPITILMDTKNTVSDEIQTNPLKFSSVVFPTTTQNNISEEAEPTTPTGVEADPKTTTLSPTESTIMMS